eukprot:TRINITY_DN29900_c0_g1_i1.p1 TRINITY_DN29900_c0_g1~~TRINITY_DN29900_c0_g1_i1.p1  ORF type:complete len:632 (-),score=76.34 TRINITY_DN29900_c0_g1_i1:48-1943(-)
MFGRVSHGRCWRVLLRFVLQLELAGAQLIGGDLLPTADVVIGSSLRSSVKCVKAPHAVECSDESPDLGPTASERFHVYHSSGGEVCAQRTDSAVPWHFYLKLRCRQHSCEYGAARRLASVEFDPCATTTPRPALPTTTPSPVKTTFHTIPMTTTCRRTCACPGTGITSSCIAPTRDCLIWGDPHFMTFDSTRADFFDEGEYWIVKSPKIHIQGRYLATPFTHGLAALSKIAVGGPFIGKHVIVVGAMEEQQTTGIVVQGKPGEILMDGQPILQKFPDEYAPKDCGCIRLTYNDHGKLVDQAQAKLESSITIVHIDLPLGVHLQVMRWRNHINVRITMPADEGGQDGSCGNFNGNAADDATDQIKARIGQKIPANELLFNKQAPVAPPGHKPKLEDCQGSKRQHAEDLCRRSQPHASIDSLESCEFDVCFGGDQYAIQDGLSATAAETQTEPPTVRAASAQQGASSWSSWIRTTTPPIHDCHGTGLSWRPHSAQYEYCCWKYKNKLGCQGAADYDAADHVPYVHSSSPYSDYAQRDSSYEQTGSFWRAMRKDAIQQTKPWNAAWLGTEGTLQLLMLVTGAVSLILLAAGIARRVCCQDSHSHRGAAVFELLAVDERVQTQPPNSEIAQDSAA